MQKLMNEKIIPKIMAFVNLKGIQAIKDGMVYSMPLLIVGSVSLIITNFPIQAVVDILEQTGIKAENAFDTPSGTPAGILILISFFKNQQYTNPTIKPTIIAPIIPCPAVQLLLMIPPTISPLSVVMEAGVIIINTPRATIAPLKGSCPSNLI